MSADWNESTDVKCVHLCGNKGTTSPTRNNYRHAMLRIKDPVGRHVKKVQVSNLDRRMRDGGVPASPRMPASVSTWLGDFQLWCGVGIPPLGFAESHYETTVSFEFLSVPMGTRTRKMPRNDECSKRDIPLVISGKRSEWNVFWNIGNISFNSHTMKLCMKCINSTVSKDLTI